MQVKSHLSFKTFENIAYQKIWVSKKNSESEKPLNCPLDNIKQENTIDIVVFLIINL